MKRHPLLTILMVVGGILMLLPGVCAVGFMAIAGSSNIGSGIVTLWFFCFVISGLGVLLIVKAFR
jgi:hypothetical protein